MHVCVYSAALSKQAGHKVETGFSDHAGMAYELRHSQHPVFSRVISSQQRVINLQIHLCKIGLIPITFPDT